jgi:hypothetical protein
VSSIGSGIASAIFFLAGNSPTYYINCIFSNFTNNNYYYAGFFFILSQHNVSFTIDNSIFDSISDQNQYSLLECTSNDYAGQTNFNFTNSVVKNIYNSAQSSMYSGVFYLRNFKHIGINITYVNISTPSSTGFVGGVYYVDNQPYASIALTNCSFLNVTNAGYGAAIYTNSAKNFTLTGCEFQKCVSTAGKGGAIFINSTGIFTFVTCRFYDNSASSGGSDIDHNLIIYSYYSSSNFFSTCSNSSFPRTLFPNNQNLDNFLLGLLELLIVIIVFF